MSIINIYTVVFFCIFIQMSALWAISLILENPSIIDLFWPINIVWISLYFLYTSQSLHYSTLTVCLLLLIWGTRLATYIWYCRIRKNQVDKRYLMLAEKWTMSRSLGYFFHYQFQGVLSVIISTPFIFITTEAVSRSFLYSSILNFIIITGILGEAIADFQLHQHRSLSPKTVCSNGLWHYSRHPNYFFDWLTWCGFAGYALPCTGGAFALLSPITLFIIFYLMSGPLTEDGSAKTKGKAFVDYQKSTPFFFPWFKKIKF